MRALVALSATLLGPSAAATTRRFPTLWQYPGGCNAASTLQFCINTIAQAGDTVQVVTDTPIAENLAINKDLTLQAGIGFHPTIAGSLSIMTASGAVHVDVSGLTMEAFISVNLTKGFGNSVDLHSLHLNEDAGTGGLSVGAAAPGTVSLTDSTVTGVFNHANAILFDSHLATGGSVKFVADRNHISGGKDPSAGTGLRLITSQQGDITLDASDNTFWGLCSLCGAGGIYIAPNGPTVDQVNVIGNSVDGIGAPGMLVDDSVTMGGELRLNAFDNVLSHSPYGARFQAVSGFDEVNFGANDSYANTYGDVWFGNQVTPNLAKNPRYANEPVGKLALRATSPLIDRGMVCTPGGIGPEDVRGKARLAGGSVDVGAYEVGAVAPTGAVLLGTAITDTLTGTAGADILCGYAGDDTLDGAGGNDYIDGGSGADHLIGGAGADLLFGGPDADLCLDSKDGVGGNDSIDGGKGSDA